MMKPFVKRFCLLLACLLAFSLCAQAEQFTMDFEYVRYFAPSAAAWLYQPGTSINHPVVWTDDRVFYLENRYDSRRDASGAIYMMREDSADLTAPVITLRGKNCMDYTLFGTLSEYAKAEYYQQNPTFYLISPEGSWQLDVFAGLRTTHGDAESWVVTADTRAEKLPAILESSFLQPDPALLPDENDAWVVMTTEASNNNGSRFVIYARKRPLAQEDVPVIYMNQMGESENHTVSGYVTAEGVGTWLVYGQNDPLWRRFIFESANSGKTRPFGDGGCGPTAIAIALANLVPAQELPRLLDYAAEENGYVFCTCCINDRRCSGKHVPYSLTTAEDFVRFMPLAVADFAMGNNTFGAKGRGSGYGTNMSYLEAICSVYGVTVTRAQTQQEAVDFLREGRGLVITCASGTYTPFTKSSHFLVLAAATDEHFYVLDPMRRESYAPMDASGVITLIEPGLARVRLADMDICHFSPYYLLEYQP